MTIGERIRSHRKIKCLSQKQLAEKSGLSEIAIRKYEAGDRKPKIEQITKLAEALGISESQLADVPTAGIGDMNTVGQALSALYTLRTQAGWTLSYALTDEQAIDPTSIKLQFQHEKINEALLKLINAELGAAHDMALYDEMDDDYEWERNITTALLDETQRKLTEDDTPLAPSE